MEDIHAAYGKRLERKLGAILPVDFGELLGPIWKNIAQIRHAKAQARQRRREKHRLTRDLFNDDNKA